VKESGPPALLSPLVGVTGCCGEQCPVTRPEGFHRHRNERQPYMSSAIATLTCHRRVAFVFQRRGPSHLSPSRRDDGVMMPNWHAAHNRGDHHRGPRLRGLRGRIRRPALAEQRRPSAMACDERAYLERPPQGLCEALRRDRVERRRMQALRGFSEVRRHGVDLEIFRKKIRPSCFHNRLISLSTMRLYRRP
jgi:hypothetical protein